MGKAIDMIVPISKLLQYPENSLPAPGIILKLVSQDKIDYCKALYYENINFIHSSAVNKWISPPPALNFPSKQIILCKFKHYPQA